MRTVSVSLRLHPKTQIDPKELMKISSFFLGGEQMARAKPIDHIVELPLSELHDFPNHPFKVRDDEAMQETTDSIKQYGVLVPAIVRPREGGGYEIIAGHRRKHGSDLAGLSTMPCIVREMDNATATILMVDSNIQRENILPSERAQAYKMKLEALKQQGVRNDLTSPQVAAKFRADDEVAKDAGISGDTVRRYIRLTELAPELQQMVDDKKIGMTPAVEISYAHRAGSGLEPRHRQQGRARVHPVLHRRVPPSAEGGPNGGIQHRNLEAFQKMGRHSDRNHAECQGSACVPRGREYL